MLNESATVETAPPVPSGPELMKKIIDMINGDGIFSAGESTDGPGLCLDIAIEKPLDESEKQTIVDEFSVKWNENDSKIKNYFEDLVSALPICYFDVTTNIALSYKLSDIAIVIFDKKDSTLKVINTMRQDISKQYKRKFAKSIIIKKNLDLILKEVYQMQAMKGVSKSKQFNFLQATDETATRVAPSQDMFEVMIGTSKGNLLILNVKDFRVKLFLENVTETPVVDFIQKINFMAVGYENGQIQLFRRKLAFQGYSRYEIKQPDGFSIKALKLSPYSKHFIAIQEQKADEEQEAEQMTSSSKIEEIKYHLILYDINKAIELGRTNLIAKKGQNFELKKYFDFSQNCVFVRSDDQRSFEIYSLQNFELLCQGPDNIDYHSITFMLSTPIKNQILLVGLLGECYYYDSTGKVVDDENVTMKFPYMITPFGAFDSKIVSLSDRLTLCKLSKRVHCQTVLFQTTEQCIYFSDEMETFIIQLGHIKADFEGVLDAKISNDNKVFAHTYNAQNTRFMDLTDMKTATVMKTFKQFEPITSTFDSQYFICEDVFNKQVFRINLYNCEPDLIEDINTQMICASKFDNFAFYRDYDEEAKVYKLQVYDMYKKVLISLLNVEFHQEFFFQLSQYEHNIIISTKEGKLIKVDCKRPRDMKIVVEVDHDIGYSTHISFDIFDKFFACGGDLSGDVYIYDLASMQRIQIIDNHIGKNTVCYFVETNRLVTKNDDQMIYWRFDKKLKLLFKLTDEIKIIQGYNRKLAGIVLNDEISLWTEQLTHELTNNILVIQPNDLKKEWTVGPIIFVYPFILNYYLEATEEDKIKLMPHIVKYVVLPYGFSILSKLVYTNQKTLVKAACKIENQRYIRDINGNTPLLYALKRQDYECVDNILIFLSKSNSGMNTVSFSALLLLIKVAPQQLLPFIDSCVQKLTDGMADLARKRDPNAIEFFEYDMETRLKPDVIYAKIFDADAPETQQQTAVFMWCQLNLNCELGSRESILFAQALASCPDENIFKTVYIDMLLKHKWAKMKPFANFLMFLTIFFTATISVHSFMPGQTFFIHLLTAQNYFWAGVEFIIFWQSGFSFKYCGMINIWLFFVLNIYSDNTLEGATKEIDQLLPMINWLAWFQMILQLQQFDIVRTFVTIFLISVQALTGFNYFLFLMIFTFATTQDIIQKNMERHELIGDNRGPYSVEFYEKYGAIQTLEENLIELWDCIFQTWIAIIKGDFAQNEGTIWRLFVYISTFISTVILLNLIIAFISDSYAKVMSQIEEKKNKTINAMTLRLEKVMFWRKYSGSKTLLIWGDYMKVEQNTGEVTEELSEVVQDQQSKSFEMFHKSIKSMFYDIQLLIIQCKQKVFFEIETLETSLLEKLSTERKILNKQMRFDSLEQQSLMNSPSLHNFSDKKSVTSQQNIENTKELSKVVHVTPRQIDQEKQIEQSQDQLIILTKTICEQLVIDQKQFKNMNKKFDTAVKSLKNEIQNLQAENLKKNQKVQSKVIKKQKKKEEPSEKNVEVNIKQELNKIKDNLTKQIENQNIELTNEIENKFSDMKQTIGQEMLAKISQKQKGMYQEMEQALEMQLEVQFKQIQKQQEAIDNQDKKKFDTLKQQSFEIKQSLSQVVALVQQNFSKK